VIDALAEVGVGDQSEAVRLIRLLGSRGYVIGHSLGDGDGEGVHGWLDARETKTLAEALADVPAAECEPTFFGVRALYERDDVPYEAMLRAAIKTISALAGRENRGLVWING
jgi:hypothetical protein